MAAPEALIGTVVGEYKLTAVLGQGGMGIVYAAEHRTLGNRTACKVLRRELMDNPESVARFLQESRLISRVRHPNLIDIFDAGELPDGRFYYVMEYLEGRSLAEVQKRERLSFPQILQIMQQVCPGLQAAHDAGIIHRDLKPANICLVEKPGHALRVKLVDFGVAKVTNVGGEQLKITRTGVLVGTPHYMSPEQINGQSLDARADVYALGIILYELCTGAVPFPGDTLGDVVIGHIQKPVPVPPPSQLATGSPSGIGDVLLQALAKDPAERYPSAAALLEDLERLARGEQTTARGKRSANLSKLPTSSSQPRARRWARVAGVLAVPIVAAMVAGLWYYRSHWSQRQGDGSDLLRMRSFALAELQRGFADGDPQVRLQSVQGVQLGHDSRQSGLLTPLLRDPDPSVQAQAALALGELGNRQAIPALLSRVDEKPEPPVRLACGQALSQLGSPSGLGILRTALNETRYPQVRLQAALLLEEAGDAAATKQLDASVQSARPGGDDWLLVHKSRARRSDAAALTRLREQAFGSDRSVTAADRLRAAASLLAIGDEQGRGPLLEASANEQPAARGDKQLAAQLLCGSADASGQAALRAALTATTTLPAERTEAAVALSGCGDRDDARTLYRLLSDGDPRPSVLRAAEAGALLRLCNGDPAVLAELSVGWASLALADEDWNVRAAAAAALADADPTQAVPLLRKALRDGRAEVRRSAAQALGRAGGKSAVTALVDAVSDSDAEVRVTALRAIASASATANANAKPGGIAAKAEPQVVAALAARVKQDNEVERVAAGSALLAIGDDTGRAAVLQGLRSGNVQAQSLAIDAAAADAELRQAALVKLVADTSVAALSRMQAALALADYGDKSGAQLLREAASRGGQEGIRALAALRKLGEQMAVKPETDPKRLLSSPELETRRQAVASLSTLPVQDSVPLLVRASRDAAKEVRAQAGETAASLPGSSPPPGLPVLRILIGDSDAGVRARASALLARLLRAMESAAQPTEKPTQPPTEIKKPSTPTPVSSAGTPKPAAHTESGPSSATTTATTPPTPPASPTSAPSKGTEERAPETPTMPPDAATSAGTQLADQVKAGIEALAKKDYRRARRALEKASTLCGRAKSDEKTCTALGYDIAYNLGRVYEGQDAFAEAMGEYDKILKPGFRGKLRPDGRVAVQEAQGRLRPRLGKLRVSKLVKGRCETVDVWVLPGKHRVNVAGGQSVQVRAGETVDVPGCS